MRVEGWAWYNDSVQRVQVSFDRGQSWTEAALESRVDSSWQRFVLVYVLSDGTHTAIVRATSKDGFTQPMAGRRNHCHSVTFEVGDGSTEP